MKERERLIELLKDVEYQYTKINSIKTEDVADWLLRHGVIVPPCKVGDKFYRVETYCTEGGYSDKPIIAYSSTCEYCCEECDGKKRIDEHTFDSPLQILNLEKSFGKYVFLTKEEAEKALKGGAE